MSLNDLTELATETPTGPMQIAAILRLETPIPCDTVDQALALRLPRVPRLRQRLIPTPIGLGRPIWVDDPGFDLIRHVRRRVCDEPDDEAVVLHVAAAAGPLPRDRPLWAATLISDASGQCHALLFVIHHVLADGIGGLAALTELMDQTTDPSAPPFPTAAPSRRALLADVVASRLASVRSLPSTVHRLRTGISELRGGRSSRADQHRRPPLGSLNRPIGRRRRLATARVRVSDAVDAAHRYGATINDILLVAVAGALGAILQARGESAETFVISVPVSTRAGTTSGHLGNQVGVVPVTVPIAGPARQRLTAIAGITRAHHDRSGRGESAMMLGIAFRALARIGVFGWFINRQRLVKTFVTNIRGPRDPMLFLGSKITDIIAVSPIAGNISVAFAALSYAGTVTVTIIADFDTWPDLDILTAALQRQLNELVQSPRPDSEFE